jgi:hypothetical protein
VKVTIWRVVGVTLMVAGLWVARYEGPDNWTPIPILLAVVGVAIITHIARYYEEER